MIAKLIKFTWSIRFIRFITVGLISTIIDFGITVFLVEVFSMNPILASVIGFIGGVYNGYNLNSAITFHNIGRNVYKKSRRGFVIFTIISLIGLGIVTGLMSLFMYLKIWYVTAKAIATVIVAFWNYFANSLYTFRMKNKV